MQLIIAYLVSLVAFGLIDLTWLSSMGAVLYRPVLGDILLTSLRVGPAIAFYALFPIGIVAFAVMPGAKADSVPTALTYGALFGALAYATYDLTNYATLKNWNLQITVVDIVYGAIASGLAASLAVAALRLLAPWIGKIAP